MAQLNINLNDLPEDESTGEFEPLPAGWYAAKTTQAELKETNKGDGQYIKLRYDITGPSHEGRVVFGNLNISNPNETAQRIGQQQLGQLMKAGKLDAIEDTDQLVGLDLQIKLKIQPAKGEYGPSNNITAFKTGDSAPAKEAAAGGKSLPWTK